jgi:predicted outer membrane protein
MRTKQRRTIAFESLEVKALLSGAQGAVIQAAEATILPGPQAMTVLNASSLPTGDIQALQQDASGGTLELVLSQVEVAVGTNPEAKAYAAHLAQDHQMGDMQLMQLAMAKNVILPGSIVGQDQQTARQVLAAIGPGGFDRAYLQAMVQGNTQGVSQNQQLASTTADADVKRFAADEAATDQAHLAAAQGLLNGTGNGTFTSPMMGGTGTPSPAPPLSAGDLQYVQQQLSGSTLEMVLSQAEALNGSTSAAQLYGQDLVHDHSMANTQLVSILLAHGQILPAVLQPADLATAQRVLSAADTTGYEAAYLDAMVQSHQQAMARSQAEQSATADPNLKVFAANDVAMDTVHLTAAQGLLNAGAGSILAGVDTSGIRNVRESFRHPGNGTLAYNLTFSAGGFTYSNRYTLRITGHARPSSGAALTGRDAVKVFLQSLLNRINASSGTGGTSNGTGVTARSAGGTGGQAISNASAQVFFPNLLRRLNHRNRIVLPGGGTGGSPVSGPPSQVGGNRGTHPGGGERR